MRKSEFDLYYEKVIKTLAMKLTDNYNEFNFRDDSQALYEEYENQRIMLRMVYGKTPTSSSKLLDRHKVCACITVAIIKVRLLSGGAGLGDEAGLNGASRINEQLAFMSAWELLKGFIRADIEINKQDGSESRTVKPVLPRTFHNTDFADTFTRSLFMSNQLNSLSLPLIANVYYLLECLQTDGLEK